MASNPVQFVIAVTKIELARREAYPPKKSLVPQQSTEPRLNVTGTACADSDMNSRE
jgi:hypothetical protein